MKFGKLLPEKYDSICKQKKLFVLHLAEYIHYLNVKVSVSYVLHELGPLRVEVVLGLRGLVQQVRDGLLQRRVVEAQPVAQLGRRRLPVTVQKMS